MNKIVILALALGVVCWNGCREDEAPLTGMFTVTLENIMEQGIYFDTGTTPAIGVDSVETFTVNAVPGQHLSLATMMVQSNDLFYAFGENGIPLYDGNNTPLSGSIIAELQLWDAGTEVNQIPGSGSNQPPRQAGPDTGPDDSSTVQLLANLMDTLDYPDVAEILEINIAHSNNTAFTITISNISGVQDTLATDLAPGVWVVHDSNQSPLFNENIAASINLERLAEDGNNDMMADSLKANSGILSAIAPGAYTVGDSNGLFIIGDPAVAALELLAEEGDPSGFQNVFTTPVGSATPGPILPGQSYSFTVSGNEDDFLSFAMMLVETNDWFLGVHRVRLFSDGTPLSGNKSGLVRIFDAGTEVDEYPGLGLNQPPRGSGGADENGLVLYEDEAGSNLSDITSIVKITVVRN